MTSQTHFNDTSTWLNASQSIEELQKIHLDATIDSEATPNDSLIGKIITVRPDSLDRIQIPYNVERENKRIRNRIANLGLPQSTTNTK